MSLGVLSSPTHLLPSFWGGGRGEEGRKSPASHVSSMEGQLGHTFTPAPPQQGSRKEQVRTSLGPQTSMPARDTGNRAIPRALSALLCAEGAGERSPGPGLWRSTRWKGESVFLTEKPGTG